MAAATYEVIGRTAVIRFNHPPVNGLGHALRHAIVELVDEAQDDDAITAIVLTGTERAFSGGADVREFGTPLAGREPTLRTVIKVLETASKPVVAAIDGVALGGGLELALGAHARIAMSRARIGLPEVKLGLLPGAGGTQRLPRLIGLERAADMVVHGEILSAASLADTSLFEEVVDDRLVEHAVALAERLAGEPTALRRVRDLEVPPIEVQAWKAQQLAAAQARYPNLPAPVKCVEALAASATLPFDEGVKFERERFVQLMNSPESAALRHIFAAERAAAKVPGIKGDLPLRPIRHVGVIGAGTMGAGIAMCFLNAGTPVILLDAQAEALTRGVETIRRNYETAVKKGRLNQADVDQRLALLETTVAYPQLATVDLVIEAVVENMEIKKQVFRQLDAIVKPGAILATNTSTLDIDEIAAATGRPADVVGLHFFSPAHVMRLLEVVRAEKTADDVLLTCIDMAKKIGKKPVVAGVCDGFIGNRMLHRYYAVVNDLLIQGATPQQVDRALEAFGMAMGPFRVQDLSGLDIGWSVRKHRAAMHPDRDFSMVADRLCEAGRFGQKTGAGWYRYEAGNRTPIVDDTVLDIIAAYRKEQGVIPREISDEEIVMRSLCALVNEGARILEEGVALRASDIDVVYLNGYGFPAHRGGPMHYAATQLGLFNVARAMRQYARESEKAAEFWQPSLLLLERIEAGGSWE